VNLPMAPSRSATGGPPERLGANLRRARRERQLTQEQVAARSGVHATEVSRIESGKRDPRASTVVRLAEAIGVPPGQLLA